MLICGDIVIDKRIEDDEGERYAMNRLIIIGASGHGKVVADIARLVGYIDIAFLDDDENILECGGYPVIGKSNSAPEGDLFVAVGNGKIRKMLMDTYRNRNFPVLIHPAAVVAENTKIGNGTVVMAGAVINSGSRIEKGCIINTCASVDHDCMVGGFCHIAVGAHLCGTVSVGELSWIGAGSTISNNINICSNVIIGVGAAVIRDITHAGTYIGIPSHRLEKQ